MFGFPIQNKNTAKTLDFFNIIAVHLTEAKLSSFHFNFLTR